MLVLVDGVVNLLSSSSILLSMDRGAVDESLRRRRSPAMVCFISEFVTCGVQRIP